ncbi:molybdopterin molybdotransferase MoeA [Amphritea atlantica]|uniref:Molybdopterin molybdenumtransferase n=1 Tax=Amphritea atlantica TaxID=355243 RepID=A0ABY5GVH7_9GAMM|nr:molybdopterin molybdotransferase MoeA [Amphritea atlantica]
MSGCSCDGGGLMPFAEALNKLLASAQCIDATEILPLDQSCGRVLAETLISPIAVPPAANSAMDGYAVNTQSLPEDLCLPVSQRIAAGQQGDHLLPGTAARIFTGSEIPPGADAVVMQERCSRDGDRVILSETPSAGDNIRPAGQDILPGSCVVEKGVRLDGRHLGVIASVGLKRLRVYRRLRVEIITTGDELVMPGDSCAAGKIYNSNYYTLKGMLETLGVEVLFSGIVGDSLAETRDALSLAAERADLILSSGGVSVGEEDHVKAAVESLGELNLWRLAIKPGKPLAYGRIGQVPFMGLPGNPAAVLVTFLMIARPYLLAMQGCNVVEPPCFPVKSGFRRDRAIPRDEFLRASLEWRDGQLYAAPVHSQSSGVLSSSVLAQGFLRIPAEHAVGESDLLAFYPFDGLLS